MKTPHPPGSPEAVKLGCFCPQRDNNYGRGAYIDASSESIYWYEKHCPLHGGQNAEPVKPETVLFEIEKR